MKLTCTIWPKPGGPHETDMHTIKELLGHNNPQTTMQYMHLTSRRIDEILNPYDALLLARDNNILNQNLK